MICSILLYAALGGMGWCMNDHDYENTGFSVEDSGCAGTAAIGTQVAVGLVGFIYLLEFFFSDTLKFLRNVYTIETVESYVRRIHAVVPRLVQWIR